jgi:spermidine/putrescine transport system permease protein
LRSFNLGVARRRRIAITLLVGPALLVVGGALVVPAANLLVQSFIESAGYGQVSYHFTITNYTDVLQDPVYREVAWHSFGLGALAALICVVAGYPVAYFITFRLRRARNIALFLVVVARGDLVGAQHPVPAGQLRRDGGLGRVNY